MFDKVLFKSLTFSSTESFSKALFQFKLDIAFLIFSIFVEYFYNPKPLGHILN